MEDKKEEKARQSVLVRKLWTWLIDDFFGIVKEMRWSYVPPLMVYFAYGVSGFTGIIESFFVKQDLGLTAEFLAGLGFWAGIPWAFKMPLGHLVDLYWRWKSAFVYLGATLMAGSLLIMVGLTGYTEWMTGIMSAGKWYIISALVSPLGYVLQDVVADAMTVEAVPIYAADGSKVSNNILQRNHVTMQTLGRIAIVSGGAIVAGLGGWMAEIWSYAVMYKLSLVIPVLSVLGVTLGSFMLWQRRKKLRREGFSREEVRKMTETQDERPSPNWYILGGSAVFVALTLAVGLSSIGSSKEIIFFISMGIIIFLMAQLLKDLDRDKRCEIIGIAIIIFVFRAIPNVGAGISWWQIDVLKFNEAFFGTMRQVSSILAIGGMFALRGWMIRRPVPYLVAFLSIFSTVMFLPFVGMYYGLHEWTMAHFGFGAHTIAIIDTMVDSPLGQVAMIPMLAWIAKEAPRKQKATYFAVMAAFTNLALSASALGTNYVNKIFLVQRGQYGELGGLMIIVGAIGLAAPLLSVWLFANGSESVFFRCKESAKKAVIRLFIGGGK